MKVYKTTRKIPIELKDHIKEETFEKARVYGLDKEQYAIFKAIITDVIIVSLEFYFGFLALVWQKSQSLADRFSLDATNEIRFRKGEDYKFNQGFDPRAHMHTHTNTTAST